jgi:hypothetical protein
MKMDQSNPEAVTLPPQVTQGAQLGITSDKPVIGVNEGVTFTATGASASTSINWSGGGTPVTGQGTTFTTRFSTPGQKTVTAELITDAGTIRATGTVTINEVSGAQWVNLFPPSKLTSDLIPTFQASVDRFIAALNAAGATPRIIVTYRPVERQYLQHFAWEIARGVLTRQQFKPNLVLIFAGSIETRMVILI